MAIKTVILIYRSTTITGLVFTIAQVLVSKFVFDNGTSTIANNRYQIRHDKDKYNTVALPLSRLSNPLITNGRSSLGRKNRFNTAAVTIRRTALANPTRAL